MNSNIRIKQLLSKTEDSIKNHFINDGSGHDWWHIHRVRNMALKIAKKEGGDIFRIEMAALLHDLDDWKLVKNSNFSRTIAWLSKLKIPDSESAKILKIIEEVSFKGAGVETKATSLEAQIVQDADRLDAMGAIGIARTFAYGGNKNRLLFDPAIKPRLHDDFEAYKNSTAPSINHFYEKLLLLKDRLNTSTANEIGRRRHKYMKDFLVHFFNEWEGNY